MAINLSDLTGASTSGDILAEAQSTADFLDSVPLLKNLADVSGATDAKQFTATKQPKALPLIDGDGYCYLSGISNNTVSTPDDSSLDITGDITLEIDLTLKDWLTSTTRDLVSKYNTSGNQRSYRLYLDPSNKPVFVITSNGAFQSQGMATCSSALSFSDHQRAQLRVQWRSSDERVQFFTSTDKGQTWTQLGTDKYTSGISSIYSGTADLDIGHRTNLNHLGNSAIHSVKIYDSITPSSNSLRFNCDFTAPHIRHGDTAFECATGQVVTINQSGNDPATVVKKSVLRFDGVDDFMDGVFGQTIDGGYMFAAFSVLGNGGESSSRVFSVNSTGAFDWQSGGVIFSGQNATSGKLAQYIGGWRANHVGLFEDDNGDILHESFIESGNQVSRVNNADEASNSITHTISAEEFNIGGDSNGNSSPCIDLEYLALFPASITDSQADAVRNYINNRNIFYRWDTDGYYFYDPLSLSDGAVLSWNGRIVGSDNGDADLLVTQSTSADQPVKSGMVVTFADNTDHLDGAFSQEGWQIVGTSFGTLAYKLTGGGTSEIGTLGNLGYTRVVGDLYGVMLLPSNATNRDINEARRLLIDRGAADSVTLTNASHAWRTRKITEFRATMPVTTNLGSAWRDCSALTRFSTQLPQAATCSYAWYNNNSLSSFTTTDIKNCSNFASAWQVCSSLTQFPSGAKLGTEASNVNFVQAWRNSGLTSFNTPLPTAGDLYLAWYGCQSLTSFDSSLPSTSRVKHAWYGCTSLTDFSAGVFDNWNPSSIQNQVFWGAWDNCTSLTAQSVENILTSIATSGKYATSTGLSGGSALSDAVIDIDYDVSTGSLTAATTSAITTLKARGWGININNVLQ